MQNQLFEVMIGKRKGLVVEATMTNDKGQDVSLNKFVFNDQGFLGATLKVLQNIPEGSVLSVMVLDTTNATNLVPKIYHFTVSYDSPFNTYILNPDVDCFIVSGRFKNVDASLKTMAYPTF